MKKKKVMVFGVFDKLHQGHIYFLKQAKKYGEVVAVVAPHKVVAQLKKKTLLQSEKERMRALKKLVAKAILGDKVQGSYMVLKRYKPDIICLGYDQKWLKKDLKEKIRKRAIPRILLIDIKSYFPEKFHSSLLRKVPIKN